MTDQPHEVWLELSSGTRVLVGSELPDVPSANAIARRWRELAETQPQLFHETLPGSGAMVRGEAIIAIKAQPQAKVSKLGAGLKVPPRPGVWI